MSFSTPPNLSSIAATPAPFNSNPPLTHTSAPPAPSPHTQPTPPTLPSPTLFDFLPHLHELLIRLLDSSETPDITSTSSYNNAAPYKQQEPLSMQQLSNAVSAIRVNIGKARAAVEALPDVEKTLEEQEEEIRVLKARIKRQREVLGGVGRAG